MTREPVPASLGAWLEHHTAGAPSALRRRVTEYASGVSPASSIARSLALAAERALRDVLRHPGDRSAALDLLAADALVTLALLAQAEQGPDDLAAFAEDILQAHRPAT
jgi:hypothetical protein